MKVISSIACAILLGCVLGGCSNAPPEKKDDPQPQSKDDRIKSALALLSDDDRKIAEAQKFCPIEPKKRLGSMGKPIKVDVDGKPVFICCKGCEDGVKQDKAGTLKKVEELKAANK